MSKLLIVFAACVAIALAKPQSSHVGGGGHGGQFGPPGSPGGLPLPSHVAPGHRAPGHQHGLIPPPGAPGGIALPRPAPGFRTQPHVPLPGTPGGLPLPHGGAGHVGGGHGGHY